MGFAASALCTIWTDHNAIKDMYESASSPDAPCVPGGKDKKVHTHIIIISKYN